MINFRFHLVSLIAVFLALALGVVVGSTVIDRAIVDGLEAQIERVERNAEAQRRENGELRRRVERLEVFGDQVAPFAVQGRLADVPVAVVAVRGVDESVVHAAIQTLREAGALAPAVLWLRASWALVEEGDLDALRLALNRPVGQPEPLRNRALATLAERLAAAGPVPAPEPDPTEQGPAEQGPAEPPPSQEGPPADFLTTLAERGFLEVDPAGADQVDLATYPGVGARVVVLDGPDAHVSAESLFVPLMESLAAGPLPLLAAEVPGGDAEVAPAAVVGSVRQGDLADRVATVDGVDDVTGRIGLVLALDALGAGSVGHYGTGPGASRQLPEPIRA